MGGPDQVEHLTSSVTFEASDDFASGLALWGAAFAVRLGARVKAQAGLHDPVQGGVGLSVAAAVEATVLPRARGSLDGADPAQRGEGCLTLPRRSGLSALIDA